MTVKEAIEYLVMYELECPHSSCGLGCPVAIKASELGHDDCGICSERAAETLKKWFESLPDGRLSEVTIEDLL